MQNTKMIDLATGELCRYPFEIPDTFTYDRDAGCPRWEQFIDEVTCGDKRLATYLQRMVGYCMTEDTSEQCMFFLLGNGCNGKSVFVDTVVAMLGKHAMHCQASTVLGGSHDSTAMADMSRLQDARLVVALEPSASCSLDESVIKKVTDNGSRVLLRSLYSKPSEFTICFKILLTTSYIPKINHENKSLWKRIRLVPFNAQFAGEQRDTSLPEKLREELPGIFNWAIEGATEWYEHGLLSSEVM